MLAVAANVVKKELPVLPRVGLPLDPTQALRSLVEAHRDYKQVREVERTKRAEIRARSQIATARIEAEASVLREYFAQAFAERRASFDQAFAVLRAGLEKGDDHAIDAGLTVIITLAKESPIKAAAEAIQQLRDRQVSQDDGRVIEL